MHANNLTLEKLPTLQLKDSVRIYFNKVWTLPLLDEIQLKIQHMAAKKALDKQLFIMQFLMDLAVHHANHPGLTSIWDTYHGEKHIICLKKYPTYEFVPLRQTGCKCQLTYSIARCCIKRNRHNTIFVNGL